MAKTAKVVIGAVDDARFPGVPRKLGAEAANKHHSDNFARMLAPARKLLARSQIEREYVDVVGEAADGFLKMVKKAKADAVVMGSRGNGALRGTVIGSVSMKILAQSAVPVTIVR